jgi:hypothetical protein
MFPLLKFALWLAFVLSLVINQLEVVHIDALDAFYLAFFSRCEREISRLQLTSLDRLVKGGNYRGIRSFAGFADKRAADAY